MKQTYLVIKQSQSQIEFKKLDEPVTLFNTSIQSWSGSLWWNASAQTIHILQYNPIAFVFQEITWIIFIVCYMKFICRNSSFQVGPYPKNLRDGLRIQTPTFLFPTLIPSFWYPGYCVTLIVVLTFLGSVFDLINLC